MRTLPSTGHAARILCTSEPRLNDLVRRQKIVPAPRVIAGRRLWFREHLIQAAEALGILTDDIRASIEREAPSLPGAPEEVPDVA